MTKENVLFSFEKDKIRSKGLGFIQLEKIIIREDTIEISGRRFRKALMGKAERLLWIIILTFTFVVSAIVALGISMTVVVWLARSQGGPNAQLSETGSVIGLGAWVLLLFVIYMGLKEVVASMLGRREVIYFKNEDMMRS